MPEYDDFAAFYDMEYGHKENDVDFYLDMAEQYGDPVLEVGVGTGRVALELAFAGYNVQGIDISSEMLKQAHANLEKEDKATQERLTLHQADMRQFDLGQKFPLCISPFRTFLHNLTMDDQLNTLRCIRNHLKPGGIFAFDLFVPLYSVMAQKKWRDTITADELAEPNSGMTIEINIEHLPQIQQLHIQNTYLQGNIKVKQAAMTYRYIFCYEMEALLRLAGYNVKKVLGDFDGRPYDYDSGIMIFIAERGKE